MEYGVKWIMIPLLLDKAMQEFFRKQEFVDDVRAYMKKARAEYKAMILRCPGVGPKNNLVMGLYVAAYALSFYKAAPDQMTEEVFHELVNAVCYSDAMKKMYKGKDFFTKKNMETRAKNAIEWEKGEYPFNWKCSFSYDLSKRECFMTYTECAVCKMGQMEGCGHLLKYLCLTDYVSQELMGNTLYRTKTIAAGDDVCDFHIVGGKRLKG